MSRKPSLLLLCVSLLLFACDRERSKASNASELFELFEEPPVNYGSAPFWVWNDKVTKEKIDFQLNEFRKNNIRQVFIHPRSGLITEYLSEEWFELSRYSISVGEKLGMKIWLYDENTYPSGFAGGHVPYEMPESYNQGNTIEIIKDASIDKSNWQKYLAVFEVEEGNFKLLESPEQVGIGSYVAFKVSRHPEHNWYGGFNYVDLLMPGVTDKFIEVTLEAYKENIGDEFGKMVPGIFSDEPNIAPSFRSGVRYSPILFEEFIERKRYDLKPLLPALFLETPGYKKVRFDYNQVLLDLFIERWSQPMYAFTEENNLIWTGHYWEHGWPNPYHGGDNMAMYAWHQMPGIDMLFNNYDLRPDQFGNVRAVKELSSVANQLGKERTLSETFGGGGWDLTFKDMKRLADWEYVLGVNFMNEHLSFMTIKGRRKADYPQSISYHAPYWEDYKTLADYFARLSLALSQGDQVNHALVIEPTTTAWMHYFPKSKKGVLKRIEKEFRAFVDELEKRQIEYDLGSEKIIEDHGSIDGNAFVIGERSYDLVVLPPNVENINHFTLELITEYLKNGGKVLSFSTPAFVDGTYDESLRAKFEESGHWIPGDSLGSVQSLSLLKGKDFFIESPAAIDGKVYHMRRRMDDGQLIFWSNFNEEGAEEVSFRIKGKVVSFLDPMTGDIFSYPSKQDNDFVEVSFNLPAAGSKLFYIHRKNDFQRLGQADPHVENWKKLELEKSYVSRKQENCLILDYLDLTVGGRLFEDIYYKEAADSVYKFSGLEHDGRYEQYNPWTFAIQFKTDVLDQSEKFNSESGFEALYTFQVSDAFNAEGLGLVVERSDLYKVSVNGKEVQPVDDSYWIDREFDVFDISQLVKVGTNKVLLSINPMHIHAEIEPVYVIGDFHLRPEEQGFLIENSRKLDLGPWKDQGMPFYGNTVRYEKSLEVETGSSYKVRLGNWRGTVSRVFVNGEQVGIIGWDPFEFELTRFLNTGTNKVAVEVVGSLRNTFGPFHGDIKKGFVTPWSWHERPDSIPPGKSYQVLDYGLLDDFSILSSH